MADDEFPKVPAVGYDEGELRRALAQLIGHPQQDGYALSDWIYDVRDRSIEEEVDGLLFEGNSWEHPRVKRFAEILKTLERAVEAWREAGMLEPPLKRDRIEVIAAHMTHTEWQPDCVECDRERLPE